eukprot:COSAG01_NODE_72756_length_252_cov_0.673203_1_plen_52_part_10
MRLRSVDSREALALRSCDGLPARGGDTEWLRRTELRHRATSSSPLGASAAAP